MENAAVHNAVAGGIGKGYRKTCSIPQGCPLSMAIIALLLRPWLCLMREMGAQGRVLADDMLILAAGEGHGAVSYTHLTLPTKRIV